MLTNREPFIVTLAWGPEYMSAALRLRASAEPFGIPVRIVNVAGWPRERRDAWRLRPSMILDALEKDGGPVLMVDADALIERDPMPWLIPARSCDLGLFEHSLGDFWACTVYARKTAAAVRTLERWRTLMEGDDWTMDSKLLNQAVAECSPVVYRLAPELAWYAPVQEPRYGNRAPIIRQLALGSRGGVAA